MRHGWFREYVRGYAMGRHGHGEHGRGFGRGPFGGGDWSEFRGRRARRGDIKFLILDVLAAGPRHGYDVIVALEERSGGRYRPSPGSVYPTLALLEDGGFVTSETVDGKRVFTIAEAGRELLASKPASEPDDEDEGGSVDLRGSVFKLGAAVMQAARTTDGDTQAKVRAVLDRARREVYALLAAEE
jgi:DNA-binding PadR family transcriptional regulator